MFRKFGGLRYLRLMTLPPQRQPSSLWNAYLSHRRRIDADVRAATLPHFDDVVMAGVEERATRDPGGAIASYHRDLLALLGRADLHQSETDLGRARDVYDAAKRATFPAATAFTDHTQSLAGLTHNVSLGEVDLDLLRKFDLLAHDDPAFREFVSAMNATLQGVGSAPDVIAYNQFFESYAEALVLHFLRGRGIPTRGGGGVAASSLRVQRIREAAPRNHVPPRVLSKLPKAVLRCRTQRFDTEKEI